MYPATLLQPVERCDGGDGGDDDGSGNNNDDNNHDDYGSRLRIPRNNRHNSSKVI